MDLNMEDGADWQTDGWTETEKEKQMDVERSIYAAMQMYSI